MRFRELHSWDLTPQQAVAVQKDLVRRVVHENRLTDVRLVAGADIACDEKQGKAYAGVVVVSFPDLRIVEQQSAVAPLRFPYIPGLLAFREAPALLKAFSRLHREPDLIFFDGQGIAHPRGCGIAAHLGVWLDRPSIGCAKSRLFGRHEEPPVNRGGWVLLKSPDDRAIGAVVRTKDRTNPVYVSVGHRVDLETAIRYTLACGKGYRIPEPTRLADRFVASLD
jgi:deoxyribonuclease V